MFLKSVHKTICWDCVETDDATAQGLQELKAQCLRLLQLEYRSRRGPFSHDCTLKFGIKIRVDGVKKTSTNFLLRLHPTITNTALVDAVFKLYVPNKVELPCVV